VLAAKNGQIAVQTFMTDLYTVRLIVFWKMFRTLLSLDYRR